MMIIDLSFCSLIYSSTLSLRVQCNSKYNNCNFRDDDLMNKSSLSGRHQQGLSLIAHAVTKAQARSLNRT